MHLMLLGQPVGSEAHEVGRKASEMLLEQESLGRADLEMMHLEDVLAFLDTGFNGLITNDKFCMSRRGELQLSWWRRPLKLREKTD